MLERFPFKNNALFTNFAKKIAWGHWFLFFNSIWCIILGARYAFLIDWPSELLGRAYFFISLIGHFTFMAFGFYLLLLFPLAFFIKNERTYRGISVILATLGVSLVLLDSQVFASFHLHLSSLVWNLLVNPENGELARRWQLFFAFMPIILLLQMVYSRWSWQKLRSLERQRWLKYFGLFYLVAFLATHLLYAWADAVHYRPITMQKSNFPLSYPMTAHRFLQKHGFLDTQTFSAKQNAQGRADVPLVEYPKQALTYAPKGWNILMINVGGWRADKLNAQTMPQLMAYAPNALQFNHHYSTSNVAQDGLFGWLYGLFPLYKDSIMQEKQPPVWLDALRHQGYERCYFNDGVSASFLKRSVLPYFSKQCGKDLTKVVQGKPAWFALVDYQIPPNLGNAHYEQYLQRIDKKLSVILHQINWQNTVVVLSGSMGYPMIGAKDDFSQKRVHVPLWIFMPQQTGQVSDALTSHVDIVPTLMKQVLGVQQPLRAFSQGKDLMAMLPNVADPNLNQWVLLGNGKWNVIVTPNDVQYHISPRGDYEKFNADDQKEKSSRPPLGLFLDVYETRADFWAK